MRLLLLLSLLLLPISALAELYKWTDANGHVQFGDTKPEHNAKVEKIDLPATSKTGSNDRLNREEPAVDNSSALERQKKLNAVFQVEREQREADARNIAAQKSQKKQRCDELRDYQKSTENSPLYKLDAKGERKFLSENELAQHRTRLEQELKQACQ